MQSINKDEDAIIINSFSKKVGEDEMLLIKKIILDVKNETGIYQNVVNFNGDLHSLSQHLSSNYNLIPKASAELSRILWFLVKPKMDRKRMEKNGVTNGIWMYYEFTCNHPAHAKFDGVKFPLKSGVKIGMFKRIFPAQLVGCGCSIKPDLEF